MARLKDLRVFVNVVKAATTALPILIACTEAFPKFQPLKPKLAYIMATLLLPMMALFTLSLSPHSTPFVQSARRRRRRRRWQRC